MYERVPESMLARVQGLGVAVAWAGIPLGGLIGGWTAGGMGLAAALVVLGALYLVVTVVPFVQPRWRGLDAQSPRDGHEQREQDEGRRRDGEDDQELPGRLLHNGARGSGDG
jgi:hypothetical protein